MARLLLFFLGWFILGVGLAHGVPARPLYEPEEPPKPPAPKQMAIDLRGTAWLGKYITTNRTFIFEADGTLSYKSTTKTIFKNRGSWRLDGSTLYFEHNVGVNKVMDFKGTILSNGTIVGESITKTGAKTQQTLQRTILPK